MAMVREPAEVTEIKDALRRCKTVEEVHRTADHFRPAVKKMGDHPDHRVFAIQIANLKRYMIDIVIGYGRD